MINFLKLLLSLKVLKLGGILLELNCFVKKLIEQEKNEDTQGVLMVRREMTTNVSSYDYDLVILIFTKKEIRQNVRHFFVNSKKVELITFNNIEVNRLLVNGSNRNLVDWLLHGEVCFEQGEYLTSLIKRIIDFPLYERKYKMTIDFSKLIRRYVDGKKLYQQGHFLDAFNSILHSLHHLARLSVIEHGYHPEVTVWKQVKQIEPEIHKLYDELVMGEETLEKRLELLLIANNFALTSKTKIGASHLLEIMKEAAEPLSVEQLISHDEIEVYGIDLVVLIDYLVQKGLIDIVRRETNSENVFEQLYYVK